jgi:hypothetical protein
MNRTAPPKEKPLLGGEGLHQLTKPPYGAQPILQGWQREAARILNEYGHSGNPKHLSALVTPVSAMRDYTGRPTR